MNVYEFVIVKYDVDTGKIDPSPSRYAVIVDADDDDVDGDEEGHSSRIDSSSSSPQKSSPEKGKTQGFV